MAFLDSHTRDAHADLDGQVAEVDEPFYSLLGPIMYPGDPDAEPTNVYNCRCTLVYDYPEYPDKIDRVDESGENVGDMSYKEWREMKAEEKDISINENVVPASVRFLNHMDELFSNAEKIKPIEGFEDVVVHGDKYGLVIKDSEDKEVGNIAANDFVEMLQQSGKYKGGKIRLIACETGADDAIVAQTVADRLGVEVMAPSDIVWVNEKGEMTIGETPLQNTGEWRIIKPRRN